MSRRAFRRAESRRGLHDVRHLPTVDHDRPNDDLEGSDEPPHKHWLTHGLTALGVSLLGLAVAGAVSLTSTAEPTHESQERVADAATVVNLAEPVTGTDHGALEDPLRQPLSQAELDDMSKGTLLGTRERGEGTTRNSTREAVDKAIAEEQAKVRNESLTTTSSEVARASRDAAARERDTELSETGDEIEKTEERKREEKRRAEEAKRLAAERARLAKEQADNAPDGAPAPAPLPDNIDAGDAQGATTPVARGSYTIVARWGAVGSWSRYHTGVDFSAGYGTPIRAAASGVVVSGNAGGWAGNYVALQHAGGASTLYAHMSSTAVSPGQSVSVGQVIGFVGSSGRSFGPHLHFEYYPPGVTPGDVYNSRDPYSWLASLGVNP